MNPKYVRIAHRKAALLQILKNMRMDYMSPVEGSGRPLKGDLVCEEVQWGDRVVSEDAFHEVEDLLQRLIDQENTELRKFDFREREETQKIPTPKKKATKKHV